jgi:hypothetical protein
LTTACCGTFLGIEVWREGGSGSKGMLYEGYGTIEKADQVSGCERREHMQGTIVKMKSRRLRVEWGHG